MYGNYGAAWHSLPDFLLGFYLTAEAQNVPFKGKSADFSAFPASLIFVTVIDGGLSRMRESESLL